MTAPENIPELRAVAQRVADQHADLEQAGEAIRAEKAGIFRQVLEAVRPAARALAAPVGIGMTCGGPAGNTTEPAPWRGLYLAGQGPTLVDRVAVPQPEMKRAAFPERGRHAGARLLLRADGALVELSYDGPWSSVPGELSRWVATPREVEPEDVVTRYRLEQILDELVGALYAYAEGKASVRAAELRSKANRLASLSELLRGL
jgi:hypothetical protein